jgi:hypothetical protein
MYEPQRTFLEPVDLDAMFKPNYLMVLWKSGLEMIKATPKWQTESVKKESRYKFKFGVNKFGVWLDDVHSPKILFWSFYAWGNHCNCLSNSTLRIRVFSIQITPIYRKKNQNLHRWGSNNVPQPLLWWACMNKCFYHYRRYLLRGLLSISKCELVFWTSIYFRLISSSYLPLLKVLYFVFPFAQTPFGWALGQLKFWASNTVANARRIVNIMIELILEIKCQYFGLESGGLYEDLKQNFA